MSTKVIVGQMSKLFNIESYYSKLKTKQLGRPCLYLDKVETSIVEAEKVVSNGIVLVREQTNGRGQRDNKWDSPEGCAMASVRLELPKESELAKRLCFLQHILALSIARALERFDPKRLGREQVCLKWPNDIIYKSNGLNKKLGGILVSTKDQTTCYDAILSFGLNVDNRKPTTCINEILAQEGGEKNTNGLTIDCVVAEIMNNLEYLTSELSNNEKFFHELKSDYESRCMQMNKEVLDHQYGTILVSGVNDDGYLVGQESLCKGQLRTITKII